MLLAVLLVPMDSLFLFSLSPLLLLLFIIIDVATPIKEHPARVFAKLGANLKASEVKDEDCGYSPTSKLCTPVVW